MIDNAPRVLVIEDDADFRHSLCLWLGTAGYAPLEAADGREGLTLTRTARPEAVLLDLRLPEIDGFAVLAALAEDAFAPPVIVISGQDEITGVIRAFRMGAADYLEKPIVSFDLVEHALAAVLDRARLAQAVDRAQARYVTLVQNLPLLVFVLRPDHELEFVNKYCRTMLGYSREEAMAMPGWFLSRVHADDQARIRACLGDPSGTRESAQTEECRLVHKNGATIHALVTAMPAPLPPAPGLPALVEGIAVDITDRVELERFVVQEEKLKTLGAISAEVAHEIRNPLFSIAGFANRLKARLPDSHEVDIILAEARRLEDILDRIGNYLHPVDLRPRLCALTAIVTTALDFLAPELAARNITTVVELAPDLPQLRLDPELLCQVVTSLIRFAIRRLEPGGTARIATARGQRFAHLTVAYAAPSPVRDPELLFLPFEEGEERVGLPLAHRVVKNMGGSLSFEQTEDGQTVFTVRLPMDAAPEDRENG
jgi:PAS domain S-box-containing protein